MAKDNKNNKVSYTINLYQREKAHKKSFEDKCMHNSFF